MDLSHITYVPKIARKGEPDAEGKVSEPKWTGHIVVRHFSFDERYDHLERIGALGKDDSRVKIMREVVKASEAHYVEVALARRDGAVAGSFADLGVCPELQDTRMEIAAAMLNGFDEGNG